MNVLDSARLLARRIPGGIESTAPRLDITPSTLRHQLAGFGGYKFALENAELLTQFAIEQRVDNPLAILNAMASNCGALVVPLPALQVGTSSTFEQLATAAHEFAQFIAVTAAAVSDGKVTGNELADVDAELADLIGCAQRVRAGLAAIHEQGKPNATAQTDKAPLSRQEVPA